MLTEIAQVYNSLGKQRRALAVLCGENKLNPNCAEIRSLLNLFILYHCTDKDVSATNKLQQAVS
ncbi:hypothetical protein NUACC21_29950 [Scytonema sp. NUACC21]